MADKPFFITTPIYYINSTPHVGHAYTQIAADARARFERLRGRRVYFLTGTDENALKVARVAVEAGRDPLKFCDELAQAFRNVWDKLAISYDDFIRTTESRHREPVQKVVQKLWDDGHLKLGTYSGWYSVPDETFFREEDTVRIGGQHFIKNASEDQSRAPLEWVAEVGHFFELSKFGAELLEIYAQSPDKLLPESRRNETLRFIERGLQDTSISRTQDWGIPIPSGVPESAGKVVYVWFPDALLNYASAPGFWSDDPYARGWFEQIWPPDLQLMSKDIFTRFHATLWPALLLALGLELPKQLFAHGFWTVNGRKISKRDPETVIEPIAFCEGIAQASGADFEIAVDALRYYSLREVTFGSDGDFSPQGAYARYNADLANGLGNLLNRASAMTHRYFNGKAPEKSRDFDFGQNWEERLELVGSDFQNLNFSGALARIWEVVDAANKLIEDEKPWAKAKNQEWQAVADCLHALYSALDFCARTVIPVMPTAGARLWAALGQNAPISWHERALFEIGHDFPAPTPLFPRLDLAKIPPAKMETENPAPAPPEDLAPPQTLASVPSASVPSASEKVETALIGIDDFSKVELRVGKILEAERIPKADKLLRFQVDLGTEKRQILAGLAQFYSPEEMVGKTVVVVANLAPRTLRGYESQGMILAASDENGKLALVAPISAVDAGGVVR